MHHIMFDVDGTLVDSFQFDEECYIDAVFKVLGHKLNNNWSEYEHVTDAGILDQHLKQVGLVEDRNTIHSKIKNVFISNIKEYLLSNPVKAVSGANELISTLKENNNVSLSIATGGWSETALMKLESAGINISGIPIASSNDHYSRTEIMKIALQKSNISPEHKLTYFGDAEWDKLACEKLDCNFVLVGNKIKHGQAINDFSDIKQIFRLIGLEKLSA